MIPVFSRSPIQYWRDGDGRGKEEEEDESALVARPAAKLCNKELLAKQRTNVFPHSIPRWHQLCHTQVRREWLVRDGTR